jgi:hypothetical protein
LQDLPTAYRSTEVRLLAASSDADDWTDDDARWADGVAMPTKAQFLRFKMTLNMMESR